MSGVRGAGPAVEAAMAGSSAWLGPAHSTRIGCNGRVIQELPGLQEAHVLLNCTLPGLF